MSRNLNTGQEKSLVVYGDPKSFNKLIKSHGQVCKIKQAIICPCAAKNHSSPSSYCEHCHGDGFIYTYQRRFQVSDEDSRCNEKVTEIYPYNVPIAEVVKVERVTSEIQGGIREMTVNGFNDTAIFVKNDIDAKPYEKKRVTYFYDGWTKVEGDILTVDVKHRLMWPTKTLYDAGYQSGNPLKAEADIAQITRIWNETTGKEITDYTVIGNTIKSNKKLEAGVIKADYYYADLTQVISADIKTANDLEKWTNELTSGEVRLAVFPWFNLAKGDLIVLAASVRYTAETLPHISDFDQLYQVEVIELSDTIIDEDNNIYIRNTDYILTGNRYIQWISDNKPKNEKVISLRYGYKPAFIVFKDNPEVNTLENKKYPTIVFAKSWNKTSKDDISKLLVA